MSKYGINFQILNTNIARVQNKCVVNFTDYFVIFGLYLLTFKDYWKETRVKIYRALFLHEKVFTDKI